VLKFGKILKKFFEYRSLVLFTPAIEMTSLALFKREMRRIPPLSREDEYRLACRWRNHQDREAARALVNANLNSVTAIAREYRHFRLPEMDLIQEGTIGLMHAVKRFDPERGFRLATYAGWWIRAAIQDFILHNWSIVKIGTTKLQRRIFAGLKYAKEAIAALDGRGREAVAESYGVSESAYQEAADSYLQRDISIDADREGYAMVEALPALIATPEEAVSEQNWQDHQKSGLYSALAELPERDRYIVEQRHLSEEPATLKALSSELGVSIERVRQIESRAMQRLREYLT